MDSFALSQLVFSIVVSYSFILQLMEWRPREVTRLVTIAQEEKEGEFEPIFGPPNS